MLQNIARSKYPAISEKEEKMSIPLQVMALAIFDGVLLHILNMLAPATWQPIKVCRLVSLGTLALCRGPKLTQLGTFNIWH
jgi:hypothetical protein